MSSPRTRSPVSVRPLEPRRRGRIAIGVARAVSLMSRAWGQRGLGTGFKALHRVPGLRSARCEVEFLPGARFETEVFEPYWGPTLLGGRPYEPELMTALRWFAPLRPTFIDCGANYGFWSVIGSSSELDFPRVVAIEASETTFRRLRSNATRNADKFEVLLRAVGERTGDVVRLSDAEHHAVAHVSQDGTGPQVTTITVDDVVDQMGWWGHDQFLVKLDVEGYEVPAIRGCSRLRRTKDHCFIFEDFESTGFKTLAFLFENGYRVCYVNTRGEGSYVRDLAHVPSVLLREPKRGGSRNFLAFSEGRFAETLRERGAV